MNKSSNIFAFSNQELVTFLQKVKQHEAVKIVRKYEIDGNLLLAFSDHGVNMEFTDREKMVLLGVVNWTKLNLGSSSKLNLYKSRLALDEIEEEASSSTNNINNSAESIDTKSAADDDCLCNKSTEILNKAENFYLEMTDLHSKNDSNTNAYVEMTHLNPRSETPVSKTYFKFYDKPDMKETDKMSKYDIFCPKQHIPHYAYFNPFGASPSSEYHQISNVSSDYIIPLTHLQPRYEEITKERIKRYVRPEDLKTDLNAIQEHQYIEVIHPDGNIVPDSNKTENNSVKKKRKSVCDFVLSFCGYSCILGCQRK